MLTDAQAQEIVGDINLSTITYDALTAIIAAALYQREEATRQDALLIARKVVNKQIAKYYSRGKTTLASSWRSAMLAIEVAWEENTMVPKAPAIQEATP